MANALYTNPPDDQIWQNVNHVTNTRQGLDATATWKSLTPSQIAEACDQPGIGNWVSAAYSMK